MLPIAVALAGIGSCRSAPPALQRSLADVIPIVIGTTSDHTPPDAPEILARGPGGLNGSVLRSDALVPGARVRVALFSGSSVVATIDEAVKDDSGQTWGGTVDATAERLVMHYGEGGFGLVVRRPLTGDVEVGGCQGDRCVVTHFRAAMPLRCGAGQNRVGSPTGARSAREPKTIDVLVLYTDTVVAKWTSWSNPYQARAEIKTWIEDTNAAFACSGLAARLRLAGTKPIGFTESGKLRDDLNKWIDPGGNEWPVLDAERAAVGADLVSIVVSRGDDHGFANSYQVTPHYKDFAVSLVTREVALGGLRGFSHEIGHLLGAGHQKGDPSKGLFEDSHAWSFDSGLSQYLTIMSTGTDHRISRYSNPAICFGSKPTGVKDKADNVRAMNVAAPDVAKFNTPMVDGPAVSLACRSDTTCPSQAPTKR